MELRHKLHESTYMGTGSGTSTGKGEGLQDVDYYLTIDGLIRFRDIIYVPDNIELKKVILREFH